jgi:hypothetical protein
VTGGRGVMGSRRRRPSGAAGAAQCRTAAASGSGAWGRWTHGGFWSGSPLIVLSSRGRC